MYFKTPQGRIRMTKNMNGGIVMTVDDDENEQQAKASMNIKTAKRFAETLKELIKEIEP